MLVYFAKAGVIKQLALAMSLLSFSLYRFYGAIGGVIYVLTVHHRRIQHINHPQLVPAPEKSSKHSKFALQILSD